MFLGWSGADADAASRWWWRRPLLWTVSVGSCERFGIDSNLSQLRRSCLLRVLRDLLLEYPLEPEKEITFEYRAWCELSLH